MMDDTVTTIGLYLEPKWLRYQPLCQRGAGSVLTIRDWSVGRAAGAAVFLMLRYPLPRGATPFGGSFWVVLL